MNYGRAIRIAMGAADVRGTDLARAIGMSPSSISLVCMGRRGISLDKLDLIAKHKPLAWFGEGGVIQKAIEPMLTRRMRETQTFCRLEWVPSIHDKPTRARGFQARASMGLVILPQGPVGDAILDEYLRFPAGKHDDEVDCGGLIGRALDEAHPAIQARHVAPKPRDRWDDDTPKGSWKTI